MDIGYLNLLIGSLMLIVPLYFLWYYRTGLVKDTVVSVLRMTAQLFFIGFYLEFLFDLNNAWLNSLWVLIMVLIAAYTVLSRVKLPIKQQIIALSIAFFVTIALIDFFFLGYVVALPHLFDARYFIPISGMILGNVLSSNVIALNSYYGDLRREQSLYLYLLANGATHTEATARFVRQALIKAFNPTIASMAVMGLIALPGTMTGQILGGSSPNVAIKYQIMLMVAIFSSSMLSVVLSLWLSARNSFDAMGRLR